MKKLISDKYNAFITGFSDEFNELWGCFGAFVAVGLTGIGIVGCCIGIGIFIWSLI